MFDGTATAVVIHTCSILVDVDDFSDPLHRFPVSQGQEIIDQWIRNLHRTDFTGDSISKNSRVCSRHFLKSDYLDRAPDQVKKLKPGAVPTVFEDYPKHVQPVATRGRSSLSIRKREQIAASSPRKIAKVTASDHCYYTTEEKLTNKAAQREQQLVQRNKILKSKVVRLNQKLRRKVKKLKLCQD